MLPKLQEVHSSSLELQMISRLREERKVAEARALEYAKYADVLEKALREIADIEDSDYQNGYITLPEVISKANSALRKAEAGFDYNLFGGSR